jgi:hypothetical protein
LKNITLHLSLALLAAPLALLNPPFTAGAQATANVDDGPTQTLVALDPIGGTSRSAVSTAAHPIKPFSRLAIGVGVSPLGVGLQAATNINRHLNIRATGNIFNYTDDGITTEGFNVTAKINMASAGASLDYYPFRAGFRLSPGVLFHNSNRASTTFDPAPGTSFSLDDHTYYSATGANAVHGVGAFGLGDGRAAFTMTTGWGNVIPASGRHLSFPFEIGVAFIKPPTVALTLSGEVCDANGQNCVDVATDSMAQADLAAQIKSYQSDIDPLKTYPIVSFGVAYNFKIR